MKKTSTILAFATLLFGGFVLVASAQNYTPLAPLPIRGGDVAPAPYDMGTYLAGAIKLLLAIGASLAILMTVIGGTQYVANGISPDAKSNAKDTITNAFIGLALMLVSYLILNSINPKLVQFNLKLESVNSGNVDDLNPLEVVASCPGPYPDLTPLTGPALRMENGEKVIWVSDDPIPGVQQNLDKLRVEYNKAKVAIEGESAGTFGSYSPLGLSVSANSAYRPLQYQKHFFEIFDLWINKKLKDCKDPKFSTIKGTVEREYAKHSLGDAVSLPGKSAPHMRGVGLDLQINPPVGVSLPGYDPYVAAQKILDRHPEIDLRWQAITGDRAHFNLKNYPYPGDATVN